MSKQIVIHSQHMINCHKIITRIQKGEKYIKHYNKYLLPYYCNEIHYPIRLVNGHFIHPIWNTFERVLLTSGAKFDYTYVNGKDFVLEFNHSFYKDYHILSNNKLYRSSINISDKLLKPGSILLFSVDKHVAEPLIQKQLY